MTVALGITTVNRPHFFKALAKSVHKHLDLPTFVYNDGSDQKYDKRYHEAYKLLPGATVLHSSKNHGVAHAKNRLLRAMLETTDAEWLFLCEDDMRILSPGAVDDYVLACQQTGMHHLMYALHGPANIDPETKEPNPVDTTDELAFYKHCVGSWCIYSRESLETSGLFDENFYCAWEHVEHSARLARDGFTSPPYRWADVKWPEPYITEQEGSIANSSIHPSAEHQANINDGLRYWRDTKPDTFEMMFGPDAPLHQWAEYRMAA